MSRKDHYKNCHIPGIVDEINHYPKNHGGPLPKSGVWVWDLPFTTSDLRSRLILRGTKVSWSFRKKRPFHFHSVDLLEFQFLMGLKFKPPPVCFFVSFIYGGGIMNLVFGTLLLHFFEHMELYTCLGQGYGTNPWLKSLKYLYSSDSCALLSGGSLLNVFISSISHL